MNRENMKLEKMCYVLNKTIGGFDITTEAIHGENTDHIWYNFKVHKDGQLIGSERNDGGWFTYRDDRYKIVKSFAWNTNKNIWKSLKFRYEYKPTHHPLIRVSIPSKDLKLELIEHKDSEGNWWNKEHMPDTPNPNYNHLGLMCLI